MLRANLVFGLRATLFRPVASADLKISWSQLIALTLLDLAIQFAGDLARVGFAGEFLPAGLSGALFGLPVILFAAWMLARLIDGEDQTFAFAIAFSAIAIPMDVAYGAVVLLAEAGGMPSLLYALISEFGFYLAVGWCTLASAIAAIRVGGIAPERRFSALLISVVLLAIPLATVPRNTTLWDNPADASSDEQKQAARQVLESEQVFYLQPQLLEQELAALEPGRAGAINLYFVGAAGFSGEDVFMKEVNSVSAMFKQRFNTEGRSVLLINNPKTVLEAPIASVTSLDLALKRVGEVMNRDEDILFLYLTSHGSKDHRFALDFGAMQFNELDPPRLRKLLDDSGIKRRVIVISACYSGGFIDAIKDENSLIITAASPDKYSFGCSNENDFTYFGKAYFDEALRKTGSFISAFELAKPVIAEREKRQGYSSSDPLMFIGDKIRRPLELFEKQQSPDRVPAVPNKSKIPDVVDARRQHISMRLTVDHAGTDNFSRVIDRIRAFQ